MLTRLVGGILLATLAFTAASAGEPASSIVVVVLGKAVNRRQT